MQKPLKDRSAAPGRDFLHREDGSLVVFALFLFVLMIMMGGIAVDVMKYEQRRTTLQNTLDRCTLSAAAMTQDLDPEMVVEDCVDKVGLSQYLTAITVTEGLNFRSVEADARVQTSPFFLHMIGIDEFDAPGSSTAEQRINNVEIVLVLDVSGSMGNPMTGGGSKIAALKTAAKEFISTVKANDSENRVSITIVPYNAQVNLGAPLIAKYNATLPHGQVNSNCLEIPSTAFSTTHLSRTLAQPMHAYADASSSTDRGDTTDNSPVWGAKVPKWFAPNHSSQGIASAFFCRAYKSGSTTVLTNNIVRLPSGNVTTLRNNIDLLEAEGNTSITLGMRWGVALMDPAARPMFNELSTAGHIPAAFAGRPFDYTDEDAIKVIVLMTDGEHVAHAIIKDTYKANTLSPIWRSNADGNLSIQHTSGRPSGVTNQWWVPHRDPDGDGVVEGEWRPQVWTNSSNSSTAVQLTWPQVWASTRVTWVAWHLYGRALGTDSTTRDSVYTTWMNNFRSTAYASVGTMDSRLQQSCTLAKNNGVIVYGIAFEAPANGQTQISGCATSPSHYFNATGLQIQSAFRAIASNISQLRLTQ